MIYKTFQKVSNVCQLLDKSKYHATRTINGVTFTNNGDGSFTVNGTASAYTVFYIKRNDVMKKKQSIHKYLFIGAPICSKSTIFMELLGRYDGKSVWQADIGNGKFFECTELIDLYIAIQNGYTANNIVFKPQLFDLTEMYGAGNEPTTVEQFRQDFPEEMYSYSPHCFVKSYKTLLKASDVCQLLDKSKYTGTRTINGVTFTNNGDGSITVNGTATARAIFNIQISNYFPSNLIGHTCLIVPNVSLPTTTNTINIHTTSWEVSNIKPIGKIDIMPDVRISVFPGYTANNLVFRPQFFDLTEMYGAGNEPTTVEQFRQDFPEEMYDYKPYSIIPSYKKSLVCKTKNLFPYPYFETTRTRTGITFTDNGDGSITVNGTATRNTPFYLFESSTSLMGLKAGSTYTISMEGSTASCYLVVNYYSDGSWHSGRFDSFHPDFFTKTIPSTWEGFQCYILVVPGATINNAVFKPMIELGDTATDYVPYGHL